MNPGQMFASYQVIRRIAEGGMGEVYEVGHKNTKQRQALKVMLPKYANDRGWRERFLREASILKDVEKSDHIVQVTDAGHDSQTDLCYIVMEFLDGESLAERIHQRGPMDSSMVVECLRQVAGALDKVHNAGIVHRDLKPENLLLEVRDGCRRVKVIDFGIAKCINEGTMGNVRTIIAGTPQYMAPEQFLGQTPTKAADIYALGMIAYTLLVGEWYWLPEEERNENYTRAVLEGHPKNAVERAYQRRSVSLPRAFGDWFSKATHEKPSERFTSASACVESLATALKEKPQRASEPARPRDTTPADTLESAPPAAGVEAVPTINPSAQARWNSLWTTRHIAISAVAVGIVAVLTAWTEQRTMVGEAVDARPNQATSLMPVVAETAAPFALVAEPRTTPPPSGIEVVTSVTGVAVMPNNRKTRPTVPRSKTSPPSTPDADRPRTAGAPSNAPPLSPAPQKANADVVLLMAGTSTKGAETPTAAPRLCYQHPDSRRVIVYKKGARLAEGESPFACPSDVQ